MAAELQALREAKGDDALASMLSPTANAPVLLPAYLDCWVQSNPAPAADPEVAIFLHGPERDMADVEPRSYERGKRGRKPAALQRLSDRPP